MSVTPPWRWLLARGCLAFLLALLAAGGAAAAPSAAAQDTTPGKLLLMLDASGSMKGPDPSGVSKLEAAKKSLGSVVDALPDDAQVGLRVYGATVGGSSTSPEACADTQLVAPIGPLDRAGLKAAIAGFDAVGATPIAHSLQAGLGDLGTTGKRNLILVSDGEETCVPDPCPQIKAVIGAGVDLQVDTVGFNVNPSARQQLQCIADAGRGSYYDAADASELSTTLNKLSQRAMRAFTVGGTPVTGAAAIESAPVLTPGTFVDTTELGAAKKFYAIDRSPGSTMRFGLVARPVRDVATWNTQQFTIALQTPTAQLCEQENVFRLEQVLFPNEVMTGAVRVAGAADPGKKPTECETATRLIASVQRTKGTAAPVPIQLLVMEEPAVADWSGLPEPVEQPDPALAPATTPVTPVVGGGSFDDATTLTAGTYSDTLLPGEQVFYRVRLDFGQQLVATVDAPVPGTPPRRMFLHLRSGVYGPDRARLDRATGKPDERGTLNPTDTTALLGSYTPTVLFRNRYAKTTDGHVEPWVRRDASIAGYYYVSLTATPLPDTDKATLTSVLLRIAVNGQPTGQPRYAGGSSGGSSNGSGAASAGVGAAAGATASSDSPSPYSAWVVGGWAVVVIGAGVATVLVLRRRRVTPSA